MSFSLLLLFPACWASWRADTTHNPRSHNHATSFEKTAKKTASKSESFFTGEGFLVFFYARNHRYGTVKHLSLMWRHESCYNSYERSCVLIPSRVNRVAVRYHWVPTVPTDSHKLYLWNDQCFVALFLLLMMRWNSKTMMIVENAELVKELEH